MRHFSSLPTRRVAALFSASALAAAALVATSGSASAVVTAGPDRGDGLPGLFRDDAGLAVGPCEDVLICEEAFDPADGVYFDAGAEVGPISAIYSVGAGLDPDAGGALAIDNVVRYDATGVPNGRYTIRDPWSGNRPRTTTVTGNRMDFRVLVGNPVRTLLRANNAPAGILGDGELASRVTGSPNGFNRVVITGPGGFRESTNLFTVLGQMPANTAMTSVGVESVRLGNVNKAAPSTVNIPVTSFGTAPAQVSVTKAGANPGRFQVSQPATIAQSASGQIRVTYRPQNNRNASARLRIATQGNPGATRVVTLRGTGQDTRRARVAASTPRRGQRVGVNKNVSARFNEAVRGVKKSSFTLTNQSNGNKVRGSVSRVGRTNRYVLNPRRSLDRGTTYRVRLVGGKAAIRDLAGNPLRTKAWKFRTR